MVVLLFHAVWLEEVRNAIGIYRRTEQKVSVDVWKGQDVSNKEKK